MIQSTKKSPFFPNPQWLRYYRSWDLFSSLPLNSHRQQHLEPSMALACPGLPQFQIPRINRPSATTPSGSSRRGIRDPNPFPLACISPQKPANKRCLRCGNLYQDNDNSPTACSFHGHTTGEKGLFSFSPPHQGIDGEWSDKSGVIIYKWNEKSNRPNTGRANWKKRWSCCAEYDENAPPCQLGWHVSYDDGFTLY